VLFYVENRTANDIGITLGTSQRAVYGLIEKGLARLQEVIRNRRQETP
jgi:DNA-directed RNA polymerase specialized sigma subunit